MTARIKAAGKDRGTQRPSRTMRRRADLRRVVALLAALCVVAALSALPASLTARPAAQDRPRLKGTRHDSRRCRSNRKDFAL
jgi:hypothetical protein